MQLHNLRQIATYIKRSYGLNVKGMIHWEMLERNQSIKAQLYWQQQRVVDVIAQIHPELTNSLFLHNITLKNSSVKNFST